MNLKETELECGKMV